MRCAPEVCTDALPHGGFVGLILYGFPSTEKSWDVAQDEERS